MRVALAARVSSTRITFAIILAACAARTGAHAGQVTIHVVDRLERAVPEVVVTVVPLQPSTARPSAAAADAVMDQRNLAFTPRVLAVAVGTRVDFPNNDAVSHQVYSFSPAKKFQLPLYKGVAHPPVLFDREGLVVLGCNIHDQMVGYIYVTAAPWFGTTAGDGALTLANVPAGDYRVSLWSPLIADAPATLTRTLHIEADGTAEDRIRLTRDLRARPEPRPRPTDWDY